MKKYDLNEEWKRLHKENQKLRQELESTQVELEEWKKNAILLSPEEIYIFYKLYREQQQQERAARDEKTRAELNKLTMAVMNMRK